MKPVRPLIQAIPHTKSDTSGLSEVHKPMSYPEIVRGKPASSPIGYSRASPAETMPSNIWLIGQILTSSYAQYEWPDLHSSSFRNCGAENEYSYYMPQGKGSLPDTCAKTNGAALIH